MNARFFTGKSTPAIRAIMPLFLPLPLLVFGIRANDTYHAVAMDHLALITQLLYGRPHFHKNLSLSPILPKFARASGPGLKAPHAPGRLSADAQNSRVAC